MSLATRCPTCATSFRVVQDQLKVSAGWVRCGRCGEVFNALEGLFDLGQDATDDRAAAHDASMAPPGASLVQRIEPTWQVPGRPGPAPRDLAELRDEAAPAPPLPSWPNEPARRQEPIAAPAGSAAADDPDSQPTFADAQFAPSSAPAADDVTLSADHRPLTIHDEFDPLVNPDAMPSFVQRADRAARWRRPWVRAGLSLLSLLLLVALAVQLAIAQRDWLAARVPMAVAPLQSLCAAAGCRIEPLRRIEPLAVESSGLARVEGAPLYRLSMVLRNRSDVELMLPAIELSITDGQGQLVTRRVLSASEAGATRTTIAAGQELPLQALLSAGDRLLAGYTLEVFYP